MGNDSRHFLIIERNSKVYGKTDDLLHALLFSYVAEFEVIFRNLFVGVITRTLHRKISNCRISPNIEMKFLNRNSYYDLSKCGRQNLPDFVINKDQWETRNKRFRTINVFLYAHFQNLDQFQILEARICERKTFLWSSQSLQILL